MLWFRNFQGIAAGMVVGLASLCLQAEPTVLPAAAPGEAGKAQPEPGKEGEPATEKPPARMSVPVPPGRDTIGLVIPDRDGEGKMRMRFAMELGTRVDLDHLDMKKLMIEIFDESGKPEMTIDLPRSVLDLNSRVISTETGVLIKRSDFELTGKSMVFNTATSRGKVVGNVRMLIYNLENEAKPANSTKSP